jgi:hypothetical protein
MTDDQLQLWTDTPAAADRPRCAMCAQPARRQRTGELARYCGGNQCISRTRLCQACGTQFDIGINGAGTKYCSAECKRIGYAPSKRSAPFPNCTWCGKPATHARAHARHNAWPYICAACIEPIKHLQDRLKMHHVSADRARQLLTDPGCEICGIDIVAKRYEPGTGRMRSMLVVDHDHDCCPGPFSCGRCIRGLICTLCNTALGMVRSDTKIAEAMITYLNVYGNRDNE